MARQDQCSLRMVADYTERLYRLMSIASRHCLQKAGWKRNLALQEKQLVNTWKDIAIGLPLQSGKGPFRVGEEFDVQVDVRLGELKPDDVDVEFYGGHMKSVDALGGIWTAPMSTAECLGNGRYFYNGKLSCLISGRYGFTVRVTPRGDEALKNMPGVIAWA
jgi:starch phosphorylase